MIPTLRSKNLPLLATAENASLGNPKTNRTNRLKTLLALVSLVMGVGVSLGQTTVFTDDFSANQSATYTTSGTIGSSSWSISRSGEDFGGRINTSPAQLELTNDASGTANANGWGFASTSTSSFSSPYTTTLSSNTGLVTWNFNMRQIRTDPAGFTSGAYGVAFIIAGTSTTNNNTGSGYAVVLGQSGSTDPIRLVRYTTGIQGTMTNIISSNTTGLTDFGVEYVSVRVTYAPSTNTWELFLRNDGASAFTSPTTGTLTTQGTAIDNTHTGSSLTLMGAWWQGATGATLNAFFDNVSVSVTVSSSPTVIVTGTTNNGSSCVNSPATTQTYTITNTGTAASNVVVSSSDAQFVVSNLSSTNIGATNGTATYDVTFTPSSSGAKSATITVYYDTSTSATTSSLTGTGTTPVTQAVTSSTPTPISYTSATLKGTVNALGVCPSSTQKGFVYSLTSINSDPVNAGSGVTTTSVTSLVTGAYILALTGLTAESSYTFKAYIYDGTTYTYGASTTFSTLTLTAPGAPTIGTATVSGTTASIPFTAPASNGGSTITTYTATSSPDGITGTLTQAGSGTISVSGLTLGQAYTFTVTATNAIGTGSASSASNSITPNYCTPTSGTTSTGITNVTFNTINKTTTGSGAGGLKNYTSFSTTLTQGSTYNLSVSVNTGGNYTNYQKVWIDWNQDKVFNTTAGTANGLGEEYLLGTAINQTNGISSSCPLSVTVPSGAIIGSTRMRVSSNYNEYTTSCAQVIDGEFEDYTVIVTPPTNNWTGGISTWNTAGNWSLGAVPLSTDNITISSGSPVMDIDYTLATGRTLTISGTGGLTINPSKTLTITGTADFGGNLVTLKSDVTGTGTIGKVTGTLTGATNVTVERFIPFGKRAFRFLTPSVTTTSSIYTNWQIGGATTAGIGTHITGSTTVADGFDVTTSGNPSMFTYENNVAIGTGWLAIPNTNVTALTAGMGYRTLVRGDRNVNISVASTDDMNVATTLSATGTLKVGNVDFDGTTTPALNSTANPTTNGYSLIGNPYASPVDWELVSRTDVDVSYYAWDPNMGTPAERGRYVAYSASTHLATYTGTGNTNVSKYIQPGQAIFVKTIGASPSLTFEEADKASTFTNVFRTSSNSTLSVAVYNASEVAFASPIDATIAVFATDFDASVGLGDIEKLYSSGEHLAWSRGAKLLAMDATTPVVANDELLLKTMQFSANKSYTFKVNATNFDTSLNGYLVDQYLSSQTQLDFSTSNFITFATTTDAASYGANRFKVVFNSSALNNEEWSSKSLRIYPNPVVDNQFSIAVSPSITDKVAITIYNMIGQSVYYESATAINNSIVVRPSAILKAGVYMVQMVNNGKTNTQKIIIK